MTGCGLGVGQVGNRGQLQQMAEELSKVIALDEGESKRLEVRSLTQNGRTAEGQNGRMS